jgi:hypothetical protein
MQRQIQWQDSFRKWSGAAVNTWAEQCRDSATALSFQAVVQPQLER